MPNEFKPRRGEKRLVLWLEDTLFGLEINVSRCATRRRKDIGTLDADQTVMLEKFRELDRRFGLSGNGLTEGALLALGKVFRVVRAPGRLLLFWKSEKQS